MDVSELQSSFAACADPAQREALALEAASTATPQELVAIAGLLVDDDLRVRLGAIRALVAGRFRPAVGSLAALARSRAGEERAQALLALSSLATPADSDKLLELARGFAEGDEPDDVRAAARALIERLSAAPAPIFGLLAPERDKRRAALARTLKEHPAPAEAFLESLLESKGAGVRMDLLAGLGLCEQPAIAACAARLLERADDDLAALAARTLQQKLKDAPERARAEVARAALAACERSSSELTQTALDSCALTLAPALAAPALARRVARLDDELSERLRDALVELPAEARRAAALALVDGLGKGSQRVGGFAEALLAELDGLDLGRRASLAAIAVRAASSTGDDEELARHLGPLARLLARLMLPGSPLPRQLALGLTLSPRPADRFALVELCAALATEEAATELAKLHGGGDAAVKARAEEALRGLRSSEVEVRLEGETAVLVPAYRTSEGERLQAEGRALVSGDGARWVLQASGAPIREDETPHKGCRCCFRARALEPAGESAPESSSDVTDRPRPTCPVTGKRHLLDPVEGPLLEEGHALGGCRVCDSLRPLVREAEEVRCAACHTSYERDGEGFRPVKRAPRRYEGGEYVVTLEYPTIPEVADAPTPPTTKDLEGLSAEARRAMGANVVLFGKGSFRMWGCSGVIVGRRDDEVAILTNRGGLEEAGGERVALTAVTLGGEQVPTRVEWVASRGVDLALLTAKLQRGGDVEALLLDSAAVAHPGEEVFAVANGVGLYWSYTSGPISALRTLSTKEGLDVRFLQTPMNLPLGTGGGGIYRRDGGLCGLVSWFRMTGFGSETNFAISVDSVVATLRRERVTFGGQPLVAPE